MAKKKPEKTPEQLFSEKQEKYASEVIKALDKNPDIYQFCDLELIVPYDRTTLYKYHIDKIDNIKEKLARNKMSFKRVLRNQMRKTNNPTALIALYKLLATDEEKDALNNKGNMTGSMGETSTREAYMKWLEVNSNAD